MSEKNSSHLEEGPTYGDLLGVTHIGEHTSGSRNEQKLATYQLYDGKEGSRPEVPLLLILPKNGRRRAPLCATFSPFLTKAGGADRPHTSLFLPKNGKKGSTLRLVIDLKNWKNREHSSPRYAQISQRTGNTLRIVVPLNHEEQGPLCASLCLSTMGE